MSPAPSMLITRFRMCTSTLPTNCFETSKNQIFQGRLGLSRNRLTTNDNSATTPNAACTINAKGPRRWHSPAGFSSGVLVGEGWRRVASSAGVGAAATVLCSTFSSNAVVGRDGAVCIVNPPASVVAAVPVTSVTPSLNELPTTLTTPASTPLIPTNTVSNTNVAPPGITGGDPKAPYAISLGIVNRLPSPGHMSLCPSSQPAMTWPAPRVKDMGSLRV